MVLEPAAQALADALAAGGGPPLYTLSPDDARAVLDRAQAGDVAMPPAEVEQHTIPGGPDGEVSITVVRPVDSNGSLPAVVYTHGGGWVLGNFATHERLVRDLADADRRGLRLRQLPALARGPLSGRHRAGVRHGAVGRRARGGAGARREPAGRRRRQRRRQHDRRGDAAGQGARWAGDPLPGALVPGHQRRLRHRHLRAVCRGAVADPQGDAMVLGCLRSPTPRSGPSRRPRRCRRPWSSCAGLPPALVITDEADVLRDEGEAYGRKLRQAGVDVTAVRYEGVFHDFMMLNALAETNATRDATAQTARALKAALTGDAAS